MVGYGSRAIEATMESLQRQYDIMVGKSERRNYWQAKAGEVDGSQLLLASHCIASFDIPYCCMGVFRDISALDTSGRMNGEKQALGR